MQPINIKDASRKNWTVTPIAGTEYPGDENIQLGCLMRIADSTEVMAKNHADLLRKIQWEQEENSRRKARIAKLEKQVAAYKGIIKSQKKEILNLSIKSAQ